jgi:glucosamine-6-phosphate deaminase
MNIHIFKSKKEIDIAISNEIIQLVRKNQPCVLGLATGSTPLGIYDFLVKDHQANQTSYKQVITINLDEYVGLSPNHPESYHQFMHRNLFDHLDFIKTNNHIPNGLAKDINQSCIDYDGVLNTHVPDIQLLGIGSNGHIGFNEPGTPFHSTTHIIHLAQKTREDNARFFSSIDEVPTQAITMGIQSIMKAKKIVLIATGASKAKAIYQMITGEISTSLPASILQTHPNVDIYVDKDAAKILLEKK